MEKNVWDIYNKYDALVNEILVKEVGHSNRLSQDVMSKKPHSILQTLILLDVLQEIKKLNENLTKLTSSKEEKTVKEVKATRTVNK